MINIFFSSIISSIILIGYGTLFNKFFYDQTISKQNHWATGLNGFIFIGFLSLLINFFSPLDKLIGTIFIILSIILFILYFFKVQNKKKLLFLLLIISLSSFSIVTLSNINRPDAGLYHLPYISILQENKIILGLTNLHYRFGHASILQHISAIHNSYFLKKEFLNIPIATLVPFYLFFLIHNFINEYKNKNELNIIIIFFIFIFSVYSFNRYSNYGNDAPTNIFFFILIVYLLKIKSFKNLDNNSFFIISILCVFLMSLKPLMIIVTILPVILFLLNRNKKYLLKDKKLFICIFLIFIWLLKNTLVSGCLIFPINKTCIKELKIYNHEITTLSSNEGEAWAKSYPDSKKSMNFKTYNSDFNWVVTWLNNHFFKVVEKISPLFIFLFLFFIKKIFSKSTYSNLNLEKLKKNNNILFIILFLLYCSFFWFLKFPVYRFGLSFISSLLIFIFVYLFNYNNERIYSKKFYLIIISISFIVFYGKNVKRILENKNLFYANYPWPKIYTMDDKQENIEKKFTKISKNNVFIFFYSGGVECMYSSSPCSNYIYNNLMKEKTKNYTVFYLE